MKKYTFLIVLLLFVFTSFSQDNKFSVSVFISNPEKDNSVEWIDVANIGIGHLLAGNVNNKSLSYGLASAYHKENFSIRVRLSFTNIDFDLNGTEEISVSFIRSEIIGKGTQQKFEVAPAIIFPITNSKLKVYCGFELPYIYHGEINQNYGIVNYSVGTDSIIDGYNSSLNIPKGYSIGLGLILGFDYNLWNNFYLGAEFSPALAYQDLSGEVQYTYSGFSYNSPYENSTIYSNYLKGFTFYRNRVSFKVSYRF